MYNSSYSRSIKWRNISVLSFCCLLSFHCTESEPCHYLSMNPTPIDVDAWKRKNKFAMRFGILFLLFYTLKYIWQCSIKVAKNVKVYFSLKSWIKGTNLYFIYLPETLKINLWGTIPLGGGNALPNSECNIHWRSANTTQYFWSFL